MFSSMKKEAKPLAVRKVSFQADDAFLERLDVAAKKTGVSRSWIIRAIIDGWLRDKKLGERP
jgi:predicted transcriptional regulator